MTTFRALQITEDDNKTFHRNIIQRSTEDLPEGDVLIQVHYSSLNYKDALSASGNKGVTRNYPHTPGIDAAGIVIDSKDQRFTNGDSVIVTGYDLGMNTSGGFSEMIRVPGDWLVPCPKGLTLKESMVIGTAGFTAALSIFKMIQSGVQPDHGEILVTGATGGVGSIAVKLLSGLGYKVIALTGKSELKDTLLKIGAKDVLSRDDLNDDSNRPMLRTRWAGVIDTVGGNILSTALKTTNYGGCVTCCGNVADHEFAASVYPFILRGISLVGIDSVQCPMPLRTELWQLLAKDWKIDTNMVNEVSLSDLSDVIDQLLDGTHVGRTIIHL